jgi:plastocyanin
VRPGPRIRFLLYTLALLSSIGLTACGDTAGAEVVIESFEFRPSDIGLEAGASVTWTNEDSILHTVTSGAAGEQGVPGVSGDVAPTRDGRFDLRLDGKGSNTTFSFEQPGTYTYFCAVHNGMSGIVRVR